MSAVALALDFDSVRNGWASATLRAGDVSYRMRGFSYTTDAFSDVARFGTDVALDSLKTEARFDGEPAGWVWQFERIWKHGLPEDYFRIYDVADFYDLNSATTEALCARVDRDQVAAAILSAFEKLESDLTIDGLESAWMQPYPSRGVAALRTALATPRRGRLAAEQVASVVKVVRSTDE